jgi:hypothetical protein
MASDVHATADRRRLLNFIIIAAAALIAAAASFGASAIYANSAAHRLNAQARTQATTISTLDATIARLRRQQLTGCAAAADLGTVPLPAKPPPSRLAVKIVTDNRAAWYGNGCPGSLPVPAGLAQAAARWGIPVNGKAP